jgi:hypothetical protein
MTQFIGSRGFTHQGEKAMTGITVNVNGQDYAVGRNGSIADADGNICGFLGSDILKNVGPDVATENFSDAIVSGFTKAAVESGAKDPRASFLLGAPEMVAAGAAVMGAAAIGHAAYQAYQANQQANRAEQQAAAMQQRLAQRRGHP